MPSAASSNRSRFSFDMDPGSGGEKKRSPPRTAKQAWSRLCQIILTRRAGWKPRCCSHWISGINSAGPLSFPPRLLYKPLLLRFRLCHYFRPLSSLWMRMSLGESRKFIHKANKVCCEVTSDFQEETNENFFFFHPQSGLWVISAEKASACAVSVGCAFLFGTSQHNAEPLFSTNRVQIALELHFTYNVRHTVTSNWSISYWNLFRSMRW